MPHVKRGFMAGRWEAEELVAGQYKFEKICWLHAMKSLESFGG